ncbi:MAG TPA: hypothetical protein VGF45_03630 [Polyangia bacterium]
MKRRTFTWSLLGFAWLGGGCDPATNDQYQGKVLASLHGLVSSAPATPSPWGPVPESEVVLVWGQADGKAMKFVAEKVPVTGTFPAAFKLDLHHPPPAAVGFEFGQNRISTAILVALEKSDWKQGTVLEKGRSIEVLGMAKERLVYLEKTVSADDPAAIVLGGIHTAGFHLFAPVKITVAEAQRRRAACAILMPQKPDTCVSRDDDGDLQSIGGLPGGLDHVIQLPVATDPGARMILVGGDEPPDPCLDCEQPASRGSSETIKDAGVAQGAADGGVACGSNAPGGGSSSCSGSGADAGAADSGGAGTSGSPATPIGDPERP